MKHHWLLVLLLLALPACTGPVATGATHSSTTSSGSFTLQSGPITRIAP